jgi:long-chain acyl-CoA synthetase
MNVENMTHSENFSIFSVLVRSAELWPNRSAIVDEYGILDYRTLLVETEKTARNFVACGLREGDGVGVQARNCRGFIIAVFAAVKCGATVIPISHTLVFAERKTILERTSVHVLITDQECGLDFDALGKEVSIQDLQVFYFYETGKSRDEKIVDSVHDAAFVRYTSGTTGMAKGVVLSHRDVYERIIAANKGLQLTEQDSVLFVLPMAFHFYVSIILYLHVGAAIIIAKDHAAAALIEMIVRHYVTFFYASPLHYRMLIAAARPQTKLLETLKRAISTSNGLSFEIAEQFYSVFGIRITQAYGIIEVGLPIINFLDNTNNPQAIGQPLPDYEVAILDDDGALLESGRAGHLAVRGPGMFSAYLDPFSRRQEVLVNGWFMTGDISSQEIDGTITVRGRKKSMINVCGEKVFPEEVETVLNEHLGVAESFVYGASHPRMGETVQAKVVLGEGYKLVAEELIYYARTKLSPFKVPQQIYFVEQIEKTQSGKVYRRNAWKKL